jgi:hypothetical protein
MAATHTHATTEKLLAAVFSVRSVEAGANTSTMVQSVIRGDEKGTQFLGL